MRATFTGRCSAVESDFTTNTKSPACPVCTACDGTTVAFSSCASRSRIVENWPGHSRWSEFSNVAFSLIVPVVLSTVLSTNVRYPFGLGVAVRRRFHAAAFRAP